MKSSTSRLVVRVLSIASLPLFASGVYALENDSGFGVKPELTLGWQNNIGLASSGNDKVDTATTEVAIDLSYDFLHRSDFEIVGSLRPFYEWVHDVNGLANYGATVGLDLRGQSGTGFTAPWYSLGAHYTVIRFDDSDPRDGDWIELEAAIGKRFSPLYALSGGLRYFERWQHDESPECSVGGGSCTAPGPNWNIGDVFDHEKWGGFVHADLFFQDIADVFLEYSYWDGDVAANGTRGDFQNGVVTDDLAFGGRRSDGRAKFLVWRADAVHHTVELGATKDLTDKVTLEFSALYLWTSDVDSSVSEDDYENFALSLSLGYAF